MQAITERSGGQVKGLRLSHADAVNAAIAEDFIIMTKAEGSKPAQTELKAGTKVTTGGRDPHAHHGYVNPPVYHASTVLYPTAEDYLAQRSQYHYGRRGTPTSEALEKAIQEIEGPACAAWRCCPPACGDLRCAPCRCSSRRPRAGDRQRLWPDPHVLRHACSRAAASTTTYYDPLIGAGIAALMQPNTRAVFTEAPGSLTFEMQDIPAIAAVAHEHGALVLMDNTWASPLYFKPLDQGVDLSIQAGTKYIGGHSDLMLGTVSANKATAAAARRTPPTRWASASAPTT